MFNFFSNKGKNWGWIHIGTAGMTMYCKGRELKHKQALASPPSWNQWAIVDCHRWQMGLWDQWKFRTDNFSPPQSTGPASWRWWNDPLCPLCSSDGLIFASLLPGHRVDHLTGNAIPCPHEHSSCIVLRQNIYAERSLNTDRHSGGKNKVLHQGCLMAWIDSEPHQSCILTLEYLMNARKSAKNDVGDLNMQVYSDLLHQYVKVTKYLYW